MPRGQRSDDDDGTITLLIADGQELFGRRLSRMLSAEPGILVVGQSGDGDAAVRRAAVLGPQVAIVDAEMTTSEGQLVAEAIADESPATNVLALVDGSARAADEVGRADPDRIADAVRAAAAQR